MNAYARSGMRSLLVAAVVAVGASFMAHAGGQIVIVNEGVPASTVNKATLSAIFLGEAKTYGNGTPVVVVTLKDGATHESFLKSFLSKTAPQFTLAWRNQMFSGAVKKLPPALGTEQEMVQYVSKTPGAIGYIDDATPHPGVKVLSVTD